MLTSALLQGSSIPVVARWLKLEAQPESPVSSLPGTDEQMGSGTLHTISVNQGSPMAGKQLDDLCLPPGVLIVYIRRGSEYIVPGGSTRVSVGDQLYLLADDVVFPEVEQHLNTGNCPVQPEEPV